jgi:hypothetical protein
MVDAGREVWVLWSLVLSRCPRSRRSSSWSPMRCVFVAKLPSYGQDRRVHPQGQRDEEG